MDNDNKLINSIDEGYTNCSRFCHLKNNKKKTTKIEEKIYGVLIKNPYFHNLHKNILKIFKILGKGV